jgi:hypothetical protein
MIITNTEHWIAKQKYYNYINNSIKLVMILLIIIVIIQIRYITENYSIIVIMILSAFRSIDAIKRKGSK